MPESDLVAKIRQCPSLPSLPSIAIQVLDLASKAEIDIAEIARVISKDPALSTKILRTVNSSFYGRSQHVSTISHALVILGLQSVKTLVLGFSLVNTLTGSKAKGFKHLQYWRRSIFAATAARTLAIKLNVVQQEEAFLSALLQDIGMLVLDQVVGDQYSAICEKSPTHPDLGKNEMEAFGMTHAEVGAILAENWKLPPILSGTIGGSHNPDSVPDPALKKLAQLVQLAGFCADVFVDAEPAAALQQVRSAGASQFKLTEQTCDQLLQEIHKNTKEVATLFEINIGAAGDCEAILKKANEALVTLTLESQMRETQLKGENQELTKQATTDALTGLNNRAHFDKYLAEQLAECRAQGKPLTLLMMDVDKFKSVNDHYGHQAGDTVLKELGRLLKTFARDKGVAARYGGEEMAMILPGTPREIGKRIAETFRLAVASRPIQAGKISIPVTISIGVATFETDPRLAVSANLIKCADLAVYKAKEGGRNCVKIFAIKAAA